MGMHAAETNVLVEELLVEAYVGLHAPERDQLQPIAIDITCTLTEPHISGDDLSLTFDYVPVVEQVRKLAIGQKRRLIETLAEEIAALCLADSRVRSVVVSVRKPHKFSDVRAVGVTRTFQR